jgi:hypothetical protein
MRQSSTISGAIFCHTPFGKIRCKFSVAEVHEPDESGVDDTRKEREITWNILSKLLLGFVERFLDPNRVQHDPGGASDTEANNWKRNAVHLLKYHE